MNSVRFITLTLRGHDVTLAAAVDHLDESWKRLRKSRIWSEHVAGGVAIMEVTRHARTGRWHPHLHVLVDGAFFPQSQLKAAWLEASGDSFIVDIRVVHDRKAAAGYIAKYITKGTALASWGSDQIVEFAKALHGRRLIRTFGSLHGRPIDPKPEPLTPDGFTDLCSVSLLTAAARNGMLSAIKAIDTLCRVSPIWRIVLPNSFGKTEAIPPPTAGDLEAVVEFCRELKLAARSRDELPAHSFSIRD